MAIDAEFWARRRVLITGHTGFKGAWLSLWLQALGAEVSGLAPGAPTRPSLYELATVGAGLHEHAVDVRDAGAVREVLANAKPEIVLHLAAQPMVRRSLRDPALTYAVNVMGTVNVLEAVRCAGADVRAIVVVTSDKCYENPSTGVPGGAESAPFVEGDRLGGEDPYSSSKACAELVSAAYRSSFFGAGGYPALACARAGNVIGGGDWGEDRLIPDILRALQAGRPLRLRNPEAVRPWQHVLSPLSGYLRLAEELWRGRPLAGAFNFGPHGAATQTVREIVEQFAALSGQALSWERDAGANTPEAQRLSLDASAAERQLAWRPVWTVGEAIEKIVEWHRAHEAGAEMRAVTL